MFKIEFLILCLWCRKCVVSPWKFVLVHIAGISCVLNGFCWGMGFDSLELIVIWYCRLSVAKKRKSGRLHCVVQVELALSWAFKINFSLKFSGIWFKKIKICKNNRKILFKFQLNGKFWRPRPLLQLNWKFP